LLTDAPVQVARRKLVTYGSLLLYRRSLWTLGFSVSAFSKRIVEIWEDNIRELDRFSVFGGSVVRVVKEASRRDGFGPVDTS